MLVLDTDFITLIHRRTSREYEFLNTRLEAATATDVIAVTIISFEEQSRGWLAQIAKLKDRSRLLHAYVELEELLYEYGERTILQYDAAAADRFDELRQSKIRIGTMDLRIASIALVNDATVLSRNLRDFQKVPGLRVEDWTKP